MWRHYITNIIDLANGVYDADFKKTYIYKDAPMDEVLKEYIEKQLNVKHLEVHNKYYRLSQWSL